MNTSIKPDQINPLLLVLFISIVAISRVIMTANGHLSTFANFSPIGAMALFGGAYFKNWKAFLFPLLALWLSDILLNKLVYYGEWRFFYDGFFWTYGAFALMVVVGKVLLQNRTVTNFIGASLVVVFIHWIVTDFGVWLTGLIYPKTWAGWRACLVAAIPFERNLLLGTLVYGFIMFGSVEWFKLKFPRIAFSN